MDAARAKDWADRLAALIAEGPSPIGSVEEIATAMRAAGFPPEDYDADEVIERLKHGYEDQIRLYNEMRADRDHERHEKETVADAGTAYQKWAHARIKELERELAAEGPSQQEDVIDTETGIRFRVIGCRQIAGDEWVDLALAERQSVEVRVRSVRRGLFDRIFVKAAPRSAPATAPEDPPTPLLPGERDPRD